MLAICCRLPSVFFGVLLSLQCLAGDAARLFDSHETLSVIIEGPLDLIHKRRDEVQSHAGKLRFTDSNGQAHEFDIKLRARGKYRRRFDTCRFPPVRLNFRKKQVKGSIFHGQDRLKLVTHCQNNNSMYEQYLLKEYLAYRLYQELTDYSFRVRLLRVRWIDSNAPDETLEHYAFMIEDEERLAKRLQLPLSDARASTVERLLPYQSAVVSVFQYMIANTDFSLIRGPAGDTCCHNIILFETADGDLPVPYDFDFSGLVKARYATPNPKFRLKSVSQRLYRGRCEHNDQLNAVLQYFTDKREALLQVIDSVEGMNSKSRGRTKRFVEGFYKLTGNPKRVQSRLIKRCA